MLNAVHTAAAPIAAAMLIAASSGQVHASASPEPDSILRLAKRCAPNVDARTMRDIIAVESSGRRFAINVNGDYQLPRQPRSEQEAVKAIRWLEKNNYNYDVGLGQVNSANFDWLGVTGRELLNACANLRAAATVLTGCYSRAVRQVGEGQTALKRALSCYNTGSPKDGFKNGYVGKVVATARKVHVPALKVHAGKPTKLSGDAAKTGGETNSQGIPGAFGDPDPGAFSTDNRSAFTEKSTIGKSRNASVPDTAKANQDAVSGRQNNRSVDSSVRRKKVDTDIRRGRRTR